MLKTRNHLAHDYDGTFAAEKFQDIIKVYYPLFVKLKDDIGKYYKEWGCTDSPKSKEVSKVPRKKPQGFS